MSTYIEPQKTGENQSPFDTIKNTRPDGSEYWSARDLMPMLGYDRWENFAAALDRAKIAAEVQGHNVENLFRGVTKKGAGRPQQDYELARFACYLTAMNGDPRKPEIAAAMSYFAIQTHVAETRPQMPAVPQSMGEALRLAADEHDRAEAEKIRAEQAERKVEVEGRYRKAHEAGDGITVSDFGRKYFSEEQYMQVFEHLYKHDYLIDQRGTRISANGKKKDGHDHMKPKAKGRKFFYLHGAGTHGGKQRHRTRVRPQMEIALRDALISEGLAPNTHSTGLVLFNTEDMKGLSA